MNIQNISASVITLAGQYTLQPGTTELVPYIALEEERDFLSYVDAQQLRVLASEESFTLESLPRFTQGQVVPPLTVNPDDSPYIPPVSTGGEPILLWVAPFQHSRLYLNVTSGDMTVTMTDSPDGGQTFYAIPDAPILSASATDSNSGRVSALLPQGLCLIQFSLSTTSGGTASLSYSRQS